MSIPKQFIRIWLGPKPIPDLFEKWWEEFKVMHPHWKFITLRDKECSDLVPVELKDIYANSSCYAAQSDIARILAVYVMGGVYLDTDMMPLKPMDPLLEDPLPFCGKRSSKSFATGVFGSPAYHPSFKALIDALPEWYRKHEGRAASVQTGPAFFSSVMFGRPDVRHLAEKVFYPYNGFMAPKREERDAIFSTKVGFPPEMIAAHYGNHSWGGKPKKEKKS